MKHLTAVNTISIILCVVLYTSIPQAQDLYVNPESVVYDSLYNRYLISNSGAGYIVALDSSGSQSLWTGNQQCLAGLHIEGDVLYAACQVYGIKGFDLNTGALVYSFQIPGSPNINDIITDNQGNIYVSCPSLSRIYKIDTDLEISTIFVDTGILFPNGMYFDEPNNRIILVSYRMNCPIQAISLEDSSVSTLPAATIHNLDGLTQDSRGNWYVSSWFYNAVYRYDYEFIQPPELVAAFGDAPADICINKADDILAVPLYYTSSLELIELFPSNIESQANLVPANFISFSVYPNPFNCRSVLNLNLPSSAPLRIALYDLIGREVALIYRGCLEQGVHNLTFQADGLPSGIYYAAVRGAGISLTEKLILVK